jgi:hypothetical protein
VADGRVLDDPLDVVDEDDGERRAVGIVEDLEEELTLLRVLHPNHGIRRDEADQREVALHGELGSDGGLSSVSRAEGGRANLSGPSLSLQED